MHSGYQIMAGLQNYLESALKHVSILVSKLWSAESESVGSHECVFNKFLK